MNYSRRTEPFRYEFKPEMPCLIHLYEANKLPLDTKVGKANLLDLSPKGCKLETPLNFRVSHNECKIVVNATLTRTIEVRGTLIWQEQRTHAHIYGIQLEPECQTMVTDELKAYSKFKKHEEAEAALSQTQG